MPNNGTFIVLKFRTMMLRGSELHSRGLEQGVWHMVILTSIWLKSYHSI